MFLCYVTVEASCVIDCSVNECVLMAMKVFLFMLFGPGGS